MNSISIIKTFMQTNKVDMEFIRRFLKTRPDSGIKRIVQDLLCKCGNVKKITESTKRISSYCGSSECWMHSGKKRPDHSELMKKMANETNTLTGLFKKGSLHNKKVNTKEFRMKVLSNKNIEYGDSNIDQIWSQYLMQKNLLERGVRYETQLKKIDSTIFDILRKKWGEDLQFTNKYFEKLDPHVKDELFYDIHGILTKYNNEKVKKERGGKYQRILVNDLKYNTKIDSLHCRSLYEYNWIKFFEKNEVEWEYEPFTVMGKIKGSYTPDFLIKYGGHKIVIEVKGTMYGYPEDYIKNKIEGCMEYCEQKGYKFSFVLNQKINFETIKKGIKK